ncbi:polysaccharide deacetylase family protein [Chloroflexota bacterium]
MSHTCKQKIKRLIVSTANRLGLFDGYALLRALKKSQVAILMYHRVGTHQEYGITPVITPQDFEKQIAYLCQRFEIMRLYELVHCVQKKGGLSKKAVVITFDDGYKDNYIYAYPILKRYNVPATIFLTTGHIGTGNPFWWDKIAYIIKHATQATLKVDELGVYHLGSSGSRLKAISEIVGGLKKLPQEKKELLIEKLMTKVGVQLPANLGEDYILSWDDAREMSGGSIAFGAHSVTHPILTKLSLRQAEHEIFQSKKDIEEKLNLTVTAFSYPNGKFGDFNGEIRRILRKSGFTCAVTAIPGMIVPGIDVYELPRIMISRQVNFSIFKAYLSGLYPDLRAIQSRMLARYTLTKRHPIV